MAVNTTNPDTLHTSLINKDDSAIWPVLAALRLFLAAIVVASHVGQSFMTPRPVHILADFGAFDAVICFFVISGYSIAHSLKDGSKGFYMRRVDRIYPLYFFAIVFSTVVFLLPGCAEIPPSSVWQWLGNFVFLQGFTVVKIYTDGPVWTLAIEVVYYALAPLLARLKSWQILGLIGLSALVCLHPPGFYAGPPNQLQYGGGLLMLGWAWMGGFLYYRYQSDIRAAIILTLMGTLLIWSHSFGGTALFACFMMVFAAGKELCPKSTQIRKLMNYAGDISYPLYILHFPALIMMSLLFHINGWVAFIATFLIAAGAYHLIDRPYRNLVKRRHSAQKLRQSSVVQIEHSLVHPTR